MLNTAHLSSVSVATTPGIHGNFYEVPSPNHAPPSTLCTATEISVGHTSYHHTASSACTPLPQAQPLPWGQHAAFKRHLHSGPAPYPLCPSPITVSPFPFPRFPVLRFLYSMSSLPGTFCPLDFPRLTHPAFSVSVINVPPSQVT